jgi:flagellar hook-length control protein FliK
MMPQIVAMPHAAQVTTTKSSPGGNSVKIAMQKAATRGETNAQAATTAATSTPPAVKPSSDKATDQPAQFLDLFKAQMAVADEQSNPQAQATDAPAIDVSQAMLTAMQLAATSSEATPTQDAQPVLPQNVTSPVVQQDTTGTTAAATTDISAMVAPVIPQPVLQTTTAQTSADEQVAPAIAETQEKSQNGISLPTTVQTSAVQAVKTPTISVEQVPVQSQSTETDAINTQQTPQPATQSTATSTDSAPVQNTQVVIPQAVKADAPQANAPAPITESIPDSPDTDVSDSTATVTQAVIKAAPVQTAPKQASASSVSFSQDKPAVENQTATATQTSSSQALKAEAGVQTTTSQPVTTAVPQPVSAETSAAKTIAPIVTKETDSAETLAARLTGNVPAKQAGTASKPAQPTELSSTSRLFSIGSSAMLQNAYSANAASSQQSATAISGVTSQSGTQQVATDALLSARSVAGQVVDGLRSAVGSDRTMTISLNPPELGRVIIQLQDNGGTVTGVLRVENPVTRINIEQSLPSIVRSLEQAGIQIRRLDVLPTDSVPQQDGSFNRQHDLQGGLWDQQQSNSNAPDQTDAANHASLQDPRFVTVASEAPASSVSDSAINLYM